MVVPLSDGFFSQHRRPDVIEKKPAVRCRVTQLLKDDAAG
jgi:hypothetical protein